MQKKYRHRNHAVSLLHAHLVFSTKYRRKCITPRVFATLRASMRRTARQLGVEIIALEADGDHLHVMIHYPPQISLSKIVQRLKGASSHAVRAKRLPEVTQKLWGAAFWSPSYFVVSCGGAPLETVKAYVENQTNRNRARRNRPICLVNRKPPPRTEVRGFRLRI